MEQNPVFDWFVNQPNPPKRPMPKIKRKIPFKQMVMTEQYEVWGYGFINRKPNYFFMYSMVPCPLVYDYKIDEPSPPMVDVFAIKKSIKRHQDKLKHIK